MKLVITGAAGMTGAEAARQATARGWECACFTRADLDVADAAAVEEIIRREKPDVIVNAAAYTAVDAAETDTERAMTINGTAPGYLAASAERHGAALIHISTDYVFDGTARRAYRPDDKVGPINVYGESKLAGEIAVRASSTRHAIVRTSWVYSHEGKNFVRTMLKAGAERDEVRVVSDQHGRPTAASDLASALLNVARVMKADESVAGTFHFANSGETTWYEFAQQIFRIRGGRAPKVTPITAEQFPTPARRPQWSVLDTTTFEETFGMTPSPWTTALAETLKRIQ
jgi:dTDP-4-dehydrorhamnose reductase